MLQVDHIYEFLYQDLFADFEFWYCLNGVIKTKNVNESDIAVFTPETPTDTKIFLYDQEPFILEFADPYMKIYDWIDSYSINELVEMNTNNNLPYNIKQLSEETMRFFATNPEFLFKKKILVTSEISSTVNQTIIDRNYKALYYFFHGFAAVDWYRGYYAVNYNKTINKSYKFDFISFNRIINNDRSYRIYFVSLLKEFNLLDQGQISFNVADDNFTNTWEDEVNDQNTKLTSYAKNHIKQYLVGINKLMIDSLEIPGSASANIPRTIVSWFNSSSHAPSTVDAFWHVVTETVFYYDKLHLTEKIFKPIVSKQPFMLLAAPGNLAYLKSYGFKTFDSVIDESYDSIQDNDARVEAVVKQLHWYCNLSLDEKTSVIQQLEPIIEYNFHHFYGEFRHIITKELLDNTKALFQSIGYDDGHIQYDGIYHSLTH